MIARNLKLTIHCVIAALLAGKVYGKSVSIPGICVNRETPMEATKGNSCGIPEFVDEEVFGDNMDTEGVMKVKPLKDGGLNLKIKLQNLPKDDLVLTAWIIWVPGGVTEPPIFEVANHAIPCAPTTAGYTTGFGMDPNELRNKGKGKAMLDVDLNFNPTMPNEGPLTRETFCFQKDIPGIQSTDLKHWPNPDGVYIPTSSHYLRMYDNETGFEKLDENGDPMLFKSPVASLGVEIIAHTDKTTHGLSQGVGGVDHYFMIFFPFDGAIEE